MSRTAQLLPVVVIGVLWGLNWPAVKTLLGEIEPLTIRAVALTVSGLMLLGIAAALGHRLRPARGEMGPLLLAGLLTVFGFNILTTFGQMLTETSKAALIAYLMPALTAVFAVLILGERLSGRRIAALVVGMSGIAVLASEDFAGLMAEPLGPLLSFASAVSWALGIVASKARAWTLAPMAQAVWYLLPSGLLCWPFVVAFEDPWAQAWPSPTVQWVMVFHILGPMLVSYAIWTSLVGRLPAAVAALGTLLAPLVAVSSSVALLGDPLTWQKVLALGLILTSIALTFLGPMRAGRAA